MKVTFYGVRGSTPVSGKEYLEFGGNTSCVMVTLDDGSIMILDAGTGIRKLGKQLIERGHKQFENIFIAFSHTHWDHIQGFPFFDPAYDPKRHFTLTAMGRERHANDLESVFTGQMKTEYFPIPLEKMGAKFTFHQSGSDSFTYLGIKAYVRKHNHPGGAYSLRIENGNSTIVYSTDVEHGNSIDEEVIKFAEGADLLIHDAQYTPEEIVSKRGWGHSSWDQAVAVAEKAGVGQLALYHHDPDHTDSFLKEMEKDCQSVYKNCFLAREGLTISL